MTASPWTEDRISRLKTLWREGATAEQIAAALKNGITRSAVLGKVHRLGLSEGRPGRPPPRRAATVRAGRAPAIAPRPPAAGPPAAAGTPSVTDASVVRAAPAAPPRPVAGPDILTVRPGQCRWPYGEPGGGLVLCGRPVERGAYCGGHAAMGYRAPPGGSAALLALAGLA